jgi:hypothetical protein
MCGDALFLCEAMSTDSSDRGEERVAKIEGGEDARRKWKTYQRGGANEPD